MSVSLVPRPKIDYDILVAIMISMEGPYRNNKKVISVLSRTCRYLHVEGVKSLLARCVDLGPRDWESFGHFILADPTSRGPLLRSLEIYIGDVSETALDVFVRALRHTVYLIRLTLHSLKHFPQAKATRLCTALESLTSVKDFTLYYRPGELDHRLKSDASPACRTEYFPHLLRRLQSPLISVQLSLPQLYDSEACVIYKRERDPVSLLSNLRASLEHVALSGNITVGGHKCVYPRVTRLSLPEWGLPLLQPYIASFPNVTTLDFLYNALLCRYAKNAAVLDMKRVGLSLKEWHNINVRNQVASGTWSTIHSLQATIMDAYVYGFACRITRLHLLSVGGEHSGELAMLSAILAGTLPTVLRLAVKIWFGRSSLPILPMSAIKECLTSLEIRMNIIMHEFDLDAYIDHITDMLECMPSLKCFQLEFRCNNMENRNLEKGMSDDCVTSHLNGTGIYCEFPWVGPRCYLQDAMMHVDLYQPVRKFMAAGAPALRRVVLMWKRCRLSRYDAPPDRVVAVDLDVLPHSLDRPGNLSDKWWDVDW